MNKWKQMLLIIVTAVLFLTDTQPAFADSAVGRSEVQAIDLTPGKQKKVKFYTGAETVYFSVPLDARGKLNISFQSKELGSDVSVKLYKKGEYIWQQVKTFKYNKKKEITSGSLSSEYILPAGVYGIEVTPAKALKKRKSFSITVQFKPVAFDDQEPNNQKEDAQSMTIAKKNGKPIAYQMLLSSLQVLDTDDTVDYFKFQLKEEKKIQIKFNTKTKVSGIKLLIHKKTKDGYENIKMYTINDSNLNKKIQLSKGTYILQVMYSDSVERKQIPYSISTTAI